jgi:plastocyanin
MRLICTLLASGVVALLATASASSMAPPRLVGTVGPGFTISLKHTGKVFKTLKPGRYTFAISDKASIHNFQIEGPGVDRAITTVSFKGTKSVTIQLRKGSYKFYCKPHESSMFGRFKVA